MVSQLLRRLLGGEEGFDVGDEDVAGFGAVDGADDTGQKTPN